MKRYVSPKIENMTRKELLDLQFEKLLFFLERCYQNNPYWKERFDQARVNLKKIKSFEDFQESIPFSDKKGILKDQEAFPMYGKRLGVPLNDVTQVHLSSGTAGLAQEVHSYIDEDVELSGTVFLYHFIWAGLKKGRCYCHYVSFFHSGCCYCCFFRDSKNWWQTIYDRDT